MSEQIGNTAMTGINWELLEKAARALVAKSLQCEMWDFRTDIHGNYVRQDTLEHPCGHAGCFIGNCPFLGIEELKLICDDMGSRSIGWRNYCKRVFGISWVGHPELWHYLFSADQSGDPEDILKRVLTAKENWSKGNSDD